MDIKEFLDQDEKKDLLRLLTAGSVDDGKSTLIGRLLFDSKKIYEDHLEALERDSKRVGHAGGEIDYALLLDGLKAEREQGITIDVAYRYFSTNKRKFIIADTPGHEQYTRNMITGGSTANLAILLVDARNGVITQTKRHTYLVDLLGIKHLVLAVNKMDLVEYSQDRFEAIVADYKQFLSGLSIPDITLIPVSALKGDNVVKVTEAMPWYHGPSVLEHLENVQVTSDRNMEDFRMPIQYVLRPDKDFRGFSGKIASGAIRCGDEIMVLPSKKKSRVARIVTYEGDLDEAFCPQSISLTLEDEIDISRGEVLVPPDNVPNLSRHFEAMIVWMDEELMNPNTQFYIKHNTNFTRVRLDKIRYKIDVNSLEKSEINHLEVNEIGRAVMTTVKPLFFDPYRKNRSTGSFVLIDPVTNDTCAVGMILDKVSSDSQESIIYTQDYRDRIEKGECLISTEEREKEYGHKAYTIWITGLHRSGKNELAYLLEKEMFNRGKKVVLLDGSTIRSGLNRELDFSPDDVAEHLRRVAHIARILNDQGIIVICSFISSNENIRQQVAEIIGKDRFKLVYMETTLIKSRKNKKHLYQLAEEGKTKYFPEVVFPFEAPQNPTFVADLKDMRNNVDKILKLLNL